MFDHIKDELKYLSERDFSFEGITLPGGSKHRFSENHISRKEWKDRVFPWVFPYRKKERLVIMRKDSAKVIFLNGIMTPLSIAQYQCDMLSMMLGEDVELLHIPQSGILGDLLSCVNDRVSLRPSALVNHCAERIVDKLKRTPRIMVIGYSHGAIVAGKAMDILRGRLPASMLSGIHFVSIAGGFRQYRAKNVYAEHFCHSEDPVCRIGALSALKPKGKLFVIPRAGHHLVGDYLVGIASGDFGKRSRFYRRCRGGERFLKNVAEQI